MKLREYLETANSTIKKRWDFINKKLSKKYNITDNDIKMARKALSKKHNIKEEFLNFAFIYEPIENRVFLTFNVEDKSHKKFKSSINYTWLPKEKRGI